MDSQALKTHLEQEHGRGRFSANLREIVYGGLDGIITTFAVVAGFYGASALQNSNDLSLPLTVVLLFGFANLLADGVSMGVGDFLSTRAEQKLYERERAKEAYEVVHNRDMERQETLNLLRMRGVNPEDCKSMTAIFERNPDLWVDFMMQYELEMDDVSDAQPFRSALFTLGSFLLFGFIPLLPFVLGIASYTFLFSILGAVFALVALGVTRNRFTREGVYRSVVEVLAMGAVAGVIAYLVGTLFQI